MSFAIAQEKAGITAGIAQLADNMMSSWEVKNSHIRSTFIETASSCSIDASL